jgi:arabinofuranosyltransferase
LLAGLAGAIALVLFHGWYFDYYADDAFIALRYSRNLADGLGPNWNSTGRVEGYTSFSWMAIHAGMAKLGFDLVDTSIVLGGLSLVATFICTVLVWRLWAKDEPESGLAPPVVPAAALLGLGLVDGVAFWGLSGMETAFFMAMLTGSAYLHMREERAGGMPWSAPAFALTAMTRPEGLVAAAVTGVFKLSKAFDPAGRRQALIAALVWGGVFAALYGAYFLWRYNYYGYVFPNTYYVKVEQNLSVMSFGMGYISSSGLQYQLIAMFAGTIGLMAVQRLRRDAAYVLAISALVLLQIGLQGGDAFGYGRFVVPLLPLLFIAGLSGFAVLLKRAALEPTHAATLAAVVLVLAGLSLVSTSYNAGLDRERGAIDDREVLGAWLNEETPEQYRIAAFAIGAISYYTPDRDFLDLLGLNDTVIAHTDVPDFGKGVPAHERYNPDYVYDEVRPEIIVANDSSPYRKTDEEIWAAFGTSPVVARSNMLTDPRLAEDYEVQQLYLDERWFDFLVRKEVAAELRDEAGLE